MVDQPLVHPEMGQEFTWLGTQDQAPPEAGDRFPATTRLRRSHELPDFSSSVDGRLSGEGRRSAQDLSQADFSSPSLSKWGQSDGPARKQACASAETGGEWAADVVRVPMALE